MKVHQYQKSQSCSIEEKYLNLGETKKMNNRPQQIGEPTLVNPNSYENIKIILEDMSHHLSIGDKRQWTYIGCDGPPYCLTSRLIEANPSLND